MARGEYALRYPMYNRGIFAIFSIDAYRIRLKEKNEQTTIYRLTMSFNLHSVIIIRVISIILIRNRIFKNL